MKYTLNIIIVLFLSILATGCGSRLANPTDEVEMNIAAASNLTRVFTEIGQLFEEETGTKVTFSFGSTGQLADQIENGAPYDIFAAADKYVIDQLENKNLLLTDSTRLFAVGRIGIATKKGHSLKIEALEDLRSSEVVKLAIANPDHAPYGLAAKQALEKVGLWEELESKLVFGRNISDTLTYIETGNAEAAIIALSLVNEDHVEFSLIDDQLHEPLEQMISIVHRTKYEEQARAFIDFIKGPIGKPIMEKYGFVVPTEK